MVGVPDDGLINQISVQRLLPTVIGRKAKVRLLVMDGSVQD